MKILRVLAGFLSLVAIGAYIIASIITNNWFNSIGVLFIAILFGMYALRGNNWPQWSGRWFKNVNKKNDGNDYYTSIDFGWFKNLFRKKTIKND